jgi:protease-4
MKKFLLGILAGVIIAGVTGVVLLFAAVRFSRREPEPPKTAWLSLRLEGSMPEAPEVELPLPALEDRSPMTVVEVYSTLRRAAKDPRIKGVLLRPRGVALGWGKLEELREGILAVKKTGKPVYAWLSSPGTREYYLATAADKIFLSPEDLVDMKGLRLEATYYKGTLDKLGVQVEIEHVGRFKDAGDSFTRTSMSPDTKEALNPILDHLFNGLCGAVAEARKMKPEQVRALLDEGPFLAPQAKSKGLVDDLIYEKSAEQTLAGKAGVAEKDVISARDYLRSAGDREGRGRKIAYLVAQGDIIRGSMADMLGNDRSINPHGMARQLRMIAKDTSIRGVIVRIDSPGGDAIASDEILDEMKKLSRLKPMVISMSDVAASGGYYIAMTGDPVVAYSGTLTGSIGVIYGKVNLQGLYSKLGISKEVLKRGKFADIDSDFQALSPEGRAKLRESLEFIYDGFLQRVADGRKQKKEEIHAKAQGRVWIGADAKTQGLVDEVGGLNAAVELVKKRASLSADEAVRLVVYPARRTFWETYFGRADFEDGGQAESEASTLLRQLPAGVTPWLSGGMLRVMPFRLEIR